MGSDYVMPAFAGSFDHIWETTGANGEEASETLQLSSTQSLAGEYLSLHLFLFHLSSAVSLWAVIASLKLTIAI